MRPVIIIRIAVYIIAGALLSWALYLGWQQWQTRTRGDVMPPSKTITYTTNTPSERKTLPADTPDYNVPVNHPRVISIPSIQASGFVQPIGVDGQRRMAVPTNINFAGWYVRSTLPGQPGVSIINGHVSGRYQAGIFKNLQKLRAKDVILVQRGDRSWLTYHVTSTSLFDAGDKEALFIKRTDDAAELHLVTCGGAYNKINHSYEQRVLVVATLAGN